MRMQQKAQERRRALIIFGAMFFVAAGAATATFLGSAPRTMRTTPPTVSDDFRGATVTGDFDGTGCSQQVFDNDTGRMTMSRRPCATTTYDSTGTPVPVGTIHRLDAISKSFRRD
jgi:hypothetical protein